MLRWIFLAAGVGGFALMAMFGTQMLNFASFGVMFANFATFCLQYNGPIDRAQARIRGELAMTQPNSDARQRLETMIARPTEFERQQPMNLTTVINYATGIAGIAFLVWGVVLWAQ
jgi:hypothetical protein